MRAVSAFPPLLRLERLFDQVTTAGHSPAYRGLITVNLRSARCGQGIGDDTQLYYAKLGRDTKLSSSTNLLIRGITLAMTSVSFLCR